MANLTVAQQKAKVAATIKINGNKEITPPKDKILRDDQLDSSPNWKDGGFKFEAQVGYSTELTVTDPKAFVQLHQVDTLIPEGVVSFNGRVGEVDPQSGDYTTAQVTEVTNLYFTVARVYASILAGWTPGAGTIANGDTLQQVLQKLSGNIEALLTLPVYPGSDGKYYTLQVIDGVDSWVIVPDAYGTSIGVRTKLQAEATDDWDAVTGLYVGTTSGALVAGTDYFPGEIFDGTGGGVRYLYQALPSGWIRTEIKI